jgi:hypothetical protein
MYSKLIATFQQRTPSFRRRVGKNEALLEPGIDMTTCPSPAQEITALMQPDRAIPKRQTYMENWWLKELFGWLLSLVAISAIAAILRTYDNHKMPNWQYSISLFQQRSDFHITINSLVSIIATVFKTALLIPVVASMSQLKWIWFQEKHPLIDFQLIDMASRGALSSFVLIWHLRAR